MTNLNLNNNTIAGANNTISNNKGENNMETVVRSAVRMGRKQSGFAVEAKTAVEAKAMDVYSMFEGYKNNTSMMLPEKVCFANIKDTVKFLSNNYAIADATGMITEGVYRVLNATTIEEVAKAIKDFGKLGTEAKSGQRYVEYGELVKSSHVVPRLGGGSMRVRTCSRFEVQEFFNKRVVNLDLNACNEEDLKAIKADMQVIGRVLQEIAIDIAKDKSLDAGVDLKEVFTYIPVLSRLIRKSDNGIVDNVKSITDMIEDAISKNPVVNTGVEIDSIPEYVVEVEKFEQEYIRDWASELQGKLVTATQDFFNEQVMPVVKMAGATKEDLEIQQLVVNNGDCVNEIVKVMDLYNQYVRSLNSATDHKNDDLNSRVSSAKASADKAVKAAFRDTLYAVCAAYGHDAAMTRKLVYGATMVKGIHKANIAKAMAVLGEEDMLLMWSNEEGIAVEAVNVELTEFFEELFDANEIDNMTVNFVDDIAYNEFGEEVAYGCGMEALNGEGTIIADGNEFKFLPAKKTTVAPIGTKRVAFLNRFNRAGIMTPFFEANNKVVDAKEEATLESLLLNSGNLFFIPQAKTGDERAVGIVVNGAPMILGTTVKVGNAYIQDMFVDYKEVAGERVQANNKKHQIEQVINTKYGMLLVLGC